MADAIPAATLVLFRDRADAAPELLIVERAKGMAFAAGALVFPGGRVEPDDHLLARHAPALDPDDAAGRVAAIRETLEESGVAAGFSARPDADMIARLRAALADGQAFSSLLAEVGLALDLDALVPFARWRPNLRETRTFDTRFYIARAPADADAPLVDATENVHVFWASATDVLALCDRGEGHVIFPTRRNLERLATLGDFETARAHAARYPTDLIVPFLEERDGVAMLCIPDDRGYPVTSEPMSGVRRG